MRRWVIRGVLSAAIILAVTVFGPVRAQAETRVALLIGNGAYKNVPALPNPPNDATDLAAALGRLGFSVTRLTDANFDEMRRGLIGFGRQAAGADIAIVYYAGHGMEIGGENWLIPVDAELRRDTDAEGEAISLRTAMLQVANAGRLGLVILDACRNNPFSASMSRSIRSRAVERGFARVEPTDNVLVAYAARDGTTANDGDGRNSPFTAALLRNIESPGLELRFLFANVRDDVMAATKRTQQPFVYGSLSKDRIYLAPGTETAPAANASNANSDELAWSYLRNTTDTDALSRFVAQFPTSRFRADASKRLADLALRAEPEKPAAVRPRSDTIDVASLPPNIAPRPHAAGENCADRSTAAGVEHYCASSRLDPQLGNTYNVRNLFSGGPSVAWIEGKVGYGMGEWVTVSYDRPRLLRSLQIDNGYQKSTDIFYKNSRPRRVRLVFSSGQNFSQTLQDRFGTQTLTFKAPIKAAWVQVVIEDVYRGTKYSDTAISKLSVTSERAE